MTITFGRKGNTYGLCILIFILLFQTAMQNQIPFLSYLDEIVAMIGMILGIGYLKHLSVPTKKIIMCISIFMMMGIAGNLIYKTQRLDATVFDAFINLKFFFALIFGYSLSNNYDKKILENFIKFLVIVFFIGTIAYYAFGIFPTFEVRFGIRSLQLFFGHPSYLAGECVFLISMLCFVSDKRNPSVYIILLLMMLTLTLRTKAIAAGLVFYFFYFVFKGKIKKRYIVYAVLLVALVGYDRFSTFYGGSVESARNMLLINSFKVASDLFPFGAGFATYGSYYSGVFYSPLYNQYGLNTIWGLTPDYPIFISDTFWPMVMGQNGYIGAMFYIFGICEILKICIKKLKNTKLIFSALFPMIYLLLISIAESSFVNPIAVPLAFCMGLTLKDRKIMEMKMSE